MVLCLPQSVRTICIALLLAIKFVQSDRLFILGFLVDGMYQNNFESYGKKLKSWKLESLVKEITILLFLKNWERREHLLIQN